MDYSALTRKQLQAEAKKRGVKANGKSVDIIEALKQLDGPCDAPPVARDVEMAPEEVAVINAINAFAAAESAPPEPAAAKRSAPSEPAALAAVAASESAEMRSSSSRVLLPSAPAEPPSGALAARTACVEKAVAASTYWPRRKSSRGSR